jgi:SAM-dependent methyltransferase
MAPESAVGAVPTFADERIEDLAESAVERARDRLAGRAESVRGFVGDSLHQDPQPSVFDVTLAIGLLDYQPDLRPALQALLRRTRGVLIANVPRLTHPRNWARAAWFATLGIPFRAIGRRRLTRILRSLGHPFTVAAGPFEWLVRITPDQPGGRVAGESSRRDPSTPVEHPSCG